VIRDEANDDRDDALATFVLNSHMKSHPRVRQLEHLAEDDEEKKLGEAFLNANLLDESGVLQTDPTL
jgi:DNA replicative helicase MCM subunit Mcm2 (Cdc46/Mcm family)